MYNGYQEGTFSSQINNFRTRVASLEAENINLKNIILQQQHTINKLKEQQPTQTEIVQPTAPTVESSEPLKKPKKVK